MRSEQEMMGLILDVAHQDDRIRAVYMNGSRTNSQAPKDIYQDYDIVYVVREIDSFLADRTWIDVFGTRIMMQEPELQDMLAGKQVELHDGYGYLMLFADGNRIDLRLQIVESARNEYGTDKLTLLLMNKDNSLPVIAPPTDQDYWVQRPTEIEFHNNCNEFWWCLQNVAKGLCRDELPYAKRMLDVVVRNALDDMVAWRIGMDHDFQISVGKMGKYFKRYLPASMWPLYEATYADAELTTMWDAVFASCALFRMLAIEVGERLRYAYNGEDDQKMSAYLEQLRNVNVMNNERSQKVTVAFYRGSYKQELEQYKLPEEQEIFTAMPIEALNMASQDNNCYPIVILSGEVLVGFCVLHVGSDMTELVGNPQAILLRAFSINYEHQGKGYAKAALKLLPDFVATHFPEANEIILAVNAKNRVAHKLYEQVGFQDHGYRKMGVNGIQFVLHYRKETKRVVSYC